MNSHRGRESNGRGPGPVPERWLQCPRKSGNLIDNKFLVFKTPLNQRFDDQVAEEFRFPVEFVFQSMHSYKIKIGLWIDLTNTTRFYDKNEIEANDCKYLKLQCKGHGETPSVDQTKAFVQVCENFIRQNPLDAIGLHCTHGFNRSGFMIVAYLVEIHDWELQAALAAFARARPPGIYKKDYLLELYKRYDNVEYAPEPPPLPDWCFEYDDSVGDDADDGHSYTNKRKGVEDEGGSRPGRKKRKEFQKQNATFVPGVKGVDVVPQPLLGIIQAEVQRLCGWPGAGFPGSQPVSMDVNNIRLLHEKPYTVSWKADGVRYLMYIKGKDEVFCIDRDNSVFRIHHLNFPFKKNLQVHLKNTLVDGEMVIDKVNGVDVPRFLIYDIITLCKAEVKNEPFWPKRYEVIGKEIIEPRHEAMQRGLINRQAEPFSVRCKEFWDAREAAKLLTDKFKSTLSHEPDGLIFQPAKDPYVVGQCNSLLKWKPASLNSIDFKLQIKMEEGMGIVPKKVGELYLGGMEKCFAKLASIKGIQHLNNKIVECKFQDNKWIFMRERTDKSFPNSYKTGVCVFHSIKHPVTEDMLLHYTDTPPYSECMPPPSSTAPAPRSRVSYHH